MKKIINLFLPVFILSLLVGGGSGLAVAYFYPRIEQIINQETKQTLKVEEESASTEAVQKVLPSVVSVVISKDLSKYYEEDVFFFSPFQLNIPQGKQEIGGGTGFIISSDGMILTNRHVVSDTEAEYSVVLNDGTSYDAKVLSRDMFNDIAILKIETKDLPIVDLGDSDLLKVGDTAIAIGYTLAEYKNTVTKGIISGLGRELNENYTNLIQTDAAINQGNSGGPLINLAGQVIGINVAIDRSGQAEGVGFAIPINQAKSAIESVKQYGRIIRPMLGVRYRPITTQFAKKNSLPYEYGALIMAPDAETLAVIPGSPADKAGLEEGDIILELNGTKIDRNNSLAKLISQYKVGETIKLKIYADGQEKEITVTLEEMKESG